MELTDDDIDGFVDDLDPEDRALEDAELHAELDRREALEALAREVPRPEGPWDEADAPADGVARIDLGGLRVPVPEGVEVRVDVSPEGQVVAATLVSGGSAMQVNAFAAPRRDGIWAEVRAEIVSALGEGGGRCAEATGPWGPELRGEVPAAGPDGSPTLTAARFIGVDGPRWFLRALVTGPAAENPSLVPAFEQAIRDTVVVRGTDPMAVRDPLPLALPREAMEQVAGEAPSLELPERGPEITEIR